MRPFHALWSRRVALLAAGAVDDRTRVRTLAHLERCPTCSQELAKLSAVWRGLDDDPLRQAELPVAPEVLRTRVLSQIESAAGAARVPRSAWNGRWLVPAGALVALTLILVGLGLDLRQRWADRRAATEPAEIQVSAEMLSRMEHQLARERAARYLSEARDVLVHVASHSPRCDRNRRQIDVEDEKRRSRELLARRSLMVDVDAPAVAPARRVLEDVERTLREVAALDPCADPRQLAVLRDALTHGRLLMKIDLVSRELSV